MKLSRHLWFDACYRVLQGIDYKCDELELKDPDTVEPHELWSLLSSIHSQVIDVLASVGEDD